MPVSGGDQVDRDGCRTRPAHQAKIGRGLTEHHAEASSCAGRFAVQGCPVAVKGLLPPTECSLRSGCAMDERHGAGTLNSTLRGRGRAIKLTWVSMSVGKHSAAAPAIVGART